MNAFKSKTPSDDLRNKFYLNLGRIPKMAKQVIKGWKTSAIPLDSLKIIIDMSYYNIDELKDQLKEQSANKKAYDASIELFTNFNNTLESLYVTCKKQAEHMETKSIPLHVLRNNVNLIKTAFDKGVNYETNSNNKTNVC